jgi:hypothetical protein
VSMTVESPSRNGAATGPGVRRRRRLGERSTLGHVAPVVLAVLAGVFVVAALGDRSAMVSMPVAARVIPAGTPVNSSDTRLVRVRQSDRALLAGMVPAAELRSGWVAAVRIGVGDPITASVVTTGPAAGSGLGSMSIPVPVDQADGGAIQVGDRVDVIAPTLGGGASYVATGLRVTAVASTTTSGVLGATSASYYVVVAVNHPVALRVTAALDATGTSGSAGGGVEVVRSTGETSSPAQRSYRPPAPPATSPSSASSVPGGGTR